MKRRGKRGGQHSQLTSQPDRGPATSKGALTSATDASHSASPPSQKPKLTKAAQARFDRDFEERMAAKKVAEEAQRAKAAAAAKKNRPPSDFVYGEAKSLARHVMAPEEKRDVVTEIREAMRNSTLSIERPSKRFANSHATRIFDAVSAGAQAFAHHTQPDLLNGFIVGFDLGTSSLKVAIRQPHKAEDPVVAMVAPSELRSDGHPLLWQTVVWFQSSSGEFTLYPATDAIPLAGFKTGVIGGTGTSRVYPEIDISRTEATIAFMALQLANVLGWYERERPLGSVGGNWFLGVNVGIPVAGHDDKSTRATFEKITATAAMLASRASTLRIADIRDALRNSNLKLPLGFKLVPELAAAVSGYAEAPTSNEGAHVLVDVGASTLDIVTFNLIGRSRVSVFTAGVELLGAGALQRARETGISDDDFKSSCDALFSKVFGESKCAKRAPSLFDPRFRRRDVQLIITGGGCRTDLHDRFISEMPRPGVLGTRPIVQPNPPRRISDFDCDLSRLLLAYGLTRDEFEIVDLRAPSDIPDLTPPSGGSPAYLSPEQTYD